MAAHTAANLYSFLASGAGEFGGVVVGNDKTALFCRDACLLLGIKPFVLPDIRAVVGEDLRSYQEEMIALGESLGDFYRHRDQNGFLIAPCHTISKFLPSAELYGSFTLNFGDTIDIIKLKAQLLNYGYDSVDIVEQKGEASFRGEVIDIFLSASKSAVRILLNSEQIESIRYFDTATQKSEKTELESIEIRPAVFSLKHSDKAKIDALIAEDPSNTLIKDTLSLGLWKLQELSLGVNLLENYRFCICDEAKDEIEDAYINPQGMIDKHYFDLLQTVPNSGAFKALLTDDPKTLIEFHKTKQITIALAYETQLKANAIDLKNAPKNA
ncbi:MAG: hypothetical protein LBN32_01830, partial [Helicobacteraceae bacterium]|nr:hypothetical protein [Helicobacteraceae bacterium]